jgi:hypothetical protein
MRDDNAYMSNRTKDNLPSDAIRKRGNRRSFCNKMSSIFDTVEMAANRRKNKVLDTGPPRSMFGGLQPMSHSSAMASLSTAGSTSNPQNASAPPPEMQSNRSGVDTPKNALHIAPHSNLSPMSEASKVFSPAIKNALPNINNSRKIDFLWALCFSLSVVPVLASLYKIVMAPIFEPSMLFVPYECHLFYFGIFFGLPGITVHIFCLSLIFHQLCRTGIVLALMSIFLMIMTIEHACSTTPTISVNVMFYLLIASLTLGLISQSFFISILYQHQKTQKDLYNIVLRIAGVLLGLSLTSIIISMLDSSIPHNKPTVLVRILPLTAAMIIYCISTYWTLLPVRVVCNNM